jgi:hypothetical protein
VSSAEANGSRDTCHPSNELGIRGLHVVTYIAVSSDALRFPSSS